MAKGKVKWYNGIKGFGFIAAENGEEIFVHRSGIATTNGILDPDQDVVFEIKQGEKGAFAVDVKSE